MVYAGGAIFQGNLPKDMERPYQYAIGRKRAAQRAAKAETQATGREHQIFLTTCYRVMPDDYVYAYACWTITLAKVWKAGRLVTA